MLPRAISCGRHILCICWPSISSYIVFVGCVFPENCRTRVRPPDTGEFCQVPVSAFIPVRSKLLCFPRVSKLATVSSDTSLIENGGYPYSCSAVLQDLSLLTLQLAHP